MLVRVALAVVCVVIGNTVLTAAAGGDVTYQNGSLVGKVKCFFQVEDAVPSSGICALLCNRESDCNGLHWDQQKCKLYSKCGGKYKTETKRKFILIKKLVEKMCPRQYTTIGKSCYKFNMGKDKMNYTAGQLECRNLANGFLAAPTNQKAYDGLKDALRERFLEYKKYPFLLGYRYESGVWSKSPRSKSDVNLQKSIEDLKDGELNKPCAVLKRELDDEISNKECYKDDEIVIPVCQTARVSVRVGLKHRKKTGDIAVWPRCGVNYDLVDEKCYRIVANGSVTLEEAKLACNSSRGWLAAPQTSEYLFQILDHLMVRFGDEFSQHIWLNYRNELDDPDTKSKIVLLGNKLLWAERHENNFEDLWAGPKWGDVADSKRACVSTRYRKEKPITKWLLEDEKCEENKPKGYVCEAKPDFWYSKDD